MASFCVLGPFWIPTPKMVLLYRKYMIGPLIYPLQDKCRCTGSSEPLTFDQYIFYVSVSALTDAHKCDLSLTFGTLVGLN